MKLSRTSEHRLSYAGRGEGREGTGHGSKPRNGRPTCFLVTNIWQHLARQMSAWSGRMGGIKARLFRTIPQRRALTLTQSAGSLEFVLCPHNSYPILDSTTFTQQWFNSHLLRLLHSFNSRCWRKPRLAFPSSTCCCSVTSSFY